MGFIRAKEIPPGSGNWYDYEVKNHREGDKVVQKVIRYIGRAGGSGGGLGTTGAGISITSHPPESKPITTLGTTQKRENEMIKVTERQTKKGQKLELGYSEDGNWIKALIDGKEVASRAGIGTAQQHNFGAEYTHQLGPVLLTKVEADAINKARDTYVADRQIKKETQLTTNVPGLAELRKAYANEENYREAFGRMMEDEQNDGARPPKPVMIKSDDVAQQYPRAAMYIKAEAYSRASHYAKSSAGDKAMELIQQGGDLKEAQKILDNWLPESAKWD